MTNREERIKLQTTVTAVIHQEGPWWVGRTEEIPRVVARWRTSAGVYTTLRRRYVVNQRVHLTAGHHNHKPLSKLTKDCAQRFESP
jgi:hypothetical protein